MRKNIFFFMTLVCSLSFCGEPYLHNVMISNRLKIEKENEIKKSKYGYLKIVFPEYRNFIIYPSGKKIPNIWYLSLHVNNEKLFLADFLGNEVYTIPVPAGRVEIKYDLHNQWEGGGVPVTYQSGGGWNTFTNKEKVMYLDIEEFKTTTLDIVKSSESDFGLGCCLFVPIPTYIQDVSFEETFGFEKGEDLKSEDINKKK